MVLIALVVLDVAFLEAILQSLTVIPAILQGALVVLVAGLLVGGPVVALSFCTVAGGAGWIAVHRGRWHRVALDDIRRVTILGYSPGLSSMVLASLIALGLGLNFAVGIRPALQDSWGPLSAMGMAWPILTFAFFAWIFGPRRWRAPA